MARLPLLGLFCSFLFTLAADSQIANAGGKCADCGSKCEKTVCCQKLVPTMVLEKRIKTQCVQTKKLVEETYTVFVKKPVTKKYYKEHCVLVDAVKTQKVKEKCCSIVDVPVTRTYAVKVPEKQMREITVDKGKGCGEKQLCEVTVERTEYRTEECTAKTLAKGFVERDVTYCTKEPKKVKEFCFEETKMELIPVQRTRMVERCVPIIEEQIVEVMVCKMLPQECDCCKTCAQKYGK